MTRVTNNAVEEFLRVLNIGSAIIQGEHIITALQSNYQLRLPYDVNGSIIEGKELLSEFYGSQLPDPNVPSSFYCTCRESMDCLNRLAINDAELDYNLVDTYFTVPDFYVGCYPARALLHSSLTCFFDVDCLDIVTSAFSSYESLPSSVTVIDDSYLIISTRNTTVTALADKMFIERWNSTVTYSGYFSACSPLYCTYEYNNHRPLLEVFSAVLSLIGGLSAVLQILLPRVVRFILKRLSSKNTTTNSINTERSTVKKSRDLLHYDGERLE